MCAGPVWTLTDPHVAVGPPVPVRILPWTCHTSSVEDATSFLCAVCLFQAFKVKRRFLHPILCACSDVCVLCVVFCLLSVLLLGSIVQFMHTLHSLFRGQLHQLHYNYITWSACVCVCVCLLLNISLYT